MKIAIQELLDTLPESYEKQIWDDKCAALYEHVCQHPEEY